MKPIIYRLPISQPTLRKTQSLACSLLVDIQKAYAHVHKLGTSAAQTDIHSESTSFSVALQLFDEASELSVVSATAIIGRFVQQHRHEEAMYLFSRMLVSNIRPNEFTFGTVTHSSTALGNLYIGKQIHACATKIGLHSNVYVGSALLDHYAKLSTIEEAQRVFEDTCNRNVVSYTTLIGGYLKKERTFERCPRETLFLGMQ